MIILFWLKSYMLAYYSKSYHQIFTTVYIFLFQTKVHVVLSELQPSSQCVCPLFPFEKLTQCSGYRYMRAHRSSHVIISPVESSPSCSRACAGSRTANSRSACRLRDQCELVSDELCKILLSLLGPFEPPTASPAREWFTPQRLVRRLGQELCSI